MDYLSLSQVNLYPTRNEKKRAPTRPRSGWNRVTRPDSRTLIGMRDVVCLHWWSLFCLSLVERVSKRQAAILLDILHCWITCHSKVVTHSLVLYGSSSQRECAIVPRTRRLDKTAFLKRGSPLLAAAYTYDTQHIPRQMVPVAGRRSAPRNHHPNRFSL